MKIIIIKIVLLLILYSSVVSSQNPSEYYPMDVGDIWHYEVKGIGGGTLYEHYFYYKEVLGYGIASNGKGYYNVRFYASGDRLWDFEVHERFDTTSSQIMALEDYLGCQCNGVDNSILSLKPTTSNRYWTSCCNMSYTISLQDSNSSDSLSHIIMYGDGLHTEEKRFALHIGLVYDKSCEVLCYHTELIGYSISGNNWGTLTGIDKTKNLINNFQLFQNYPNPFNPTTVINYLVPERSYVKLIVYNIHGEVISTLVDGITNAGTYSIVFDGKLLSSGIYYYQIETDNYKEVKKMILLK